MNKIIFRIIILTVVIVGVSHLALAQYTPMEPIPGSGGVENISTFPSYIQAIYKFAVWSVGIAALLMISIGGFMYFTAAGNNSKMESAKNIISDALLGLITVMVASLILYKINPDLINLNLNSFQNINQDNPQGTMNPGGGSFGSSGYAGGWGNGDNQDTTNDSSQQTNDNVPITDNDGDILEPQPLY